MHADHQSHEHYQGHAHGLSRGEEISHVSDARLLWAVAINHLLTVGQVLAGLLSGSVALLSDAAHNFNDANALLIAYVARRVSRKSANERFTFGYLRAEMIGALINLTLLGVIGLYLVYEGTMRFFEPTEIIGWLMAAAAAFALVIDVGTAVLLWSMSRGSLNVRAAFIHNVVDALGSVAVLLGAAAIIWLKWWWVDPVITLLIATYVLWQVVTMLPQAMRVLMEGAPKNLDLYQLVSQIGQLPGVHDLHHLHVWQLDEQHRALEAHVVIESTDWQQMESIKRSVKQCLEERYAITHATLEFEFGGSADHDCEQKDIITVH